MSPGGELNLQKLLSTLRPDLDPREFLFSTFPHETKSELREHLCRCAIATFREKEGLTLVLPREDAEELRTRQPPICDAAFSGTQRMITLTCHSSLEAVGLTHAVAERLTGAGISCNVVAAFYHDHIFVARENAAAAVAALEKLQAEAQAACEAKLHDRGKAGC